MMDEAEIEAMINSTSTHCPLARSDHGCSYRVKGNLMKNELKHLRIHGLGSIG